VENAIPGDSASPVLIISDNIYKSETESKSGPGDEDRQAHFEEFVMLCRDGIAEGLRDKYRQVFIDSIPDDHYLGLTYGILGTDFKYSKGSSRGMFKSRRIKREFRLQLRINIKGSLDNAVLDSYDIPVNYRDEIEPSMQDYVRSRKLEELAPKDPGSGWSRYVEPALVISTVGVLVYLFFANR